MIACFGAPNPKPICIDRDACAQAVKRHQVKVEIIPEDEEGDIDLAALEHMIAAAANKPALIAITKIPTSSGNDQCRFNMS